MATVIVFPYIRAKVIIMSRKAGEGGGSGSAASTSILSSLVTILKDDGVSALFQVNFGGQLLLCRMAGLPPQEAFLLWTPRKLFFRAERYTNPERTGKREWCFLVHPKTIL